MGGGVGVTPVMYDRPRRPHVFTQLYNSRTGLSTHWRRLAPANNIRTLSKGQTKTVAARIARARVSRHRCAAVSLLSDKY